MRQILVKGEPGVMSAAKLGLAGPSAPLSATENKENEPHGLDGETRSMLDKENQNAMSAFEITSVDPVPADNDDLDSSIVHKSISSDDSLKVKLQRIRAESGDSISEDQPSPHLRELHAPTEAASNSVSNPPITTATTPSDDNTSKDVQPNTMAVDQDALPVQSSGSVVIAPPAITQQLPQFQPPIQGVGSTGNGPTLQPGASRFRRVNQYLKGRWTVRDKTEPEERPDSELKGPIPALRSDSVVSGGSGSPLVPRKAQPVTEMQETLHTRNTSELAQLPSSVPSDNVSDKDSSSIHVDKSSTVADTLSRNTSLSSIVAMTDKSLDGDEHLRDLEPELGLNRDPPDITYPHPSTTNLPLSGTSSSSVVIPTTVGAPDSTTANPTPAPTQTDFQSSSNSHGPSCSCESCSDG